MKCWVRCAVVATANLKRQLITFKWWREWGFFKHKSPVACFLQNIKLSIRAEGNDILKARGGQTKED